MLFNKWLIEIFFFPLPVLFFHVPSFFSFFSILFFGLFYILKVLLYKLKFFIFHLPIIQTTQKERTLFFFSPPFLMHLWPLLHSS